jgi:hypothetical protein
MSYSGPTSLSIVVENCGSPSETVTIFHTAEEAKALFATLVVDPSVAHHLFLEVLPNKTLRPTNVSGTYTDAYGVVRVFATGEID